MQGRGMKRAHDILWGFQRWLESVNESYGAAGAVVSVIFWLVVLLLALKAMLFDF